MIKIAVCDDEEIYLKQIENLIKEDKMSGYCDVYFFMRGKDVFASGIKFDIAFLDIELNEEKGLDTAMQLKTVNPDILILFVTNYTEYISEAFSVVPFQYLLKPIKKSCFTEKCRKR